MTDEARHLLKLFTYDHLPDYLAKVSKPFCDLAQEMAKMCPTEGWASYETVASLRKLLEAKDCAVRAVVLNK
jgi:hypothetical protein